MSQSNKTPGFLIFIIIIVMFLFILLPMFRFGLAHILGTHIGDGAIMFPSAGFFHGPFLPLISILLITLFWLLISVWVYNDAERNNMSGVLWGLLVFFGNIIALIIYLIVRSSATTSNPIVLPSSKTCPSCNGPVQPDYVVCPNCGASLKQTCPSCHKNVQSGWKHCAYCGEAL